MLKRIRKDTGATVKTEADARELRAQGIAVEMWEVSDKPRPRDGKEYMKQWMAEKPEEG